MPKVLLVTNDFPPTVGGIQSYLRDFVATLPAQDIIVFASTQDAAAAAKFDADQPYQIIRAKQRVLLPTPAVARELRHIIRQHSVTTVWFGASAPLGLLAKAARQAGARCIVASTHGHEVGWSMLPGARQALRFIGNNSDIVTYIAAYTLNRIRPAFGEHPRFVHLPSGVDAAAFRRPAVINRPKELAGIPAEAPIVLCMSRLVPRKGQDSLLKAWPRVIQEHPNAYLVFVGEGSYLSRLRNLAARTSHVRFTGRVSDQSAKELLHNATIFAMPARTRGRGLDLEGLGIVYLEAQAAGVPVIAGNSGGAPETVLPDTGEVVDGRNVAVLADTVVELLNAADRRQAMSVAGQLYVAQDWSWDRLGGVLREILELTN